MFQPLTMDEHTSVAHTNIATMPAKPELVIP